MAFIAIPPYNEFLRFALKRIIREEPCLDLWCPRQELFGIRSKLLLVERGLPVVCLCHGLKHIFKIGAHIQAVRMCGNNDGVKGSNSMGTVFGVAEKPVFPVMCYRA